MLHGFNKTQMRAVERAARALERAAAAVDDLPGELSDLGIVIDRRRQQLPDTTCQPAGLSSGMADLAALLERVEG